MPLDTGSSTHTLRLVDTTGRVEGPSPANYDDLGAYLKAVREHRDLPLADLAKETRVRRAYLAAIEAGDRAPLPSRPFAIGYVRSYARALGLDGELAVARYKGEWPEAVERLRNPVGVAQGASAGRVLVYVLAGVVVAAVGLWNVAQRTLIRDEPQSLDLPAAVASAPLDPGAPIRLSPTTEAPAESTIPAPYVTPGMEPTAPAAAAGSAPPGAAAAAPTGFTPRGPVFGVPAGAVAVVLQAERSVALVVHGPDGTIYFARELEAGQAYRAPVGRGLTVALGDPTAVSVYVGGRLAPPISVEPVAVDKLPPAVSATASSAAAQPRPPEKPGPAGSAGGAFGRGSEAGSHPGPGRPRLAPLSGG